MERCLNRTIDCQLHLRLKSTAALHALVSKPPIKQALETAGLCDSLPLTGKKDPVLNSLSPLHSSTWKPWQCNHHNLEHPKKTEETPVRHKNAMVAEISLN